MKFNKKAVDFGLLDFVVILALFITFVAFGLLFMFFKTQSITTTVSNEDLHLYGLDLADLLRSKVIYQNKELLFLDALILSPPSTSLDTNNMPSLQKDIDSKIEQFLKIINYNYYNLQISDAEVGKQALLKDKFGNTITPTKFSLYINIDGKSTLYSISSLDSNNLYLVKSKGVCDNIILPWSLNLRGKSIIINLCSKQLTPYSDSKEYQEQQVIFKKDKSDYFNLINDNKPTIIHILTDYDYNSNNFFRDCKKSSLFLDGVESTYLITCQSNLNILDKPAHLNYEILDYNKYNCWEKINEETLNNYLIKTQESNNAIKTYLELFKDKNNLPLLKENINSIIALNTLTGTSINDSFCPNLKGNFISRPGGITFSSIIFALHKVGLNSQLLSKQKLINDILKTHNNNDNKQNINNKDFKKYIPLIAIINDNIDDKRYINLKKQCRPNSHDYVVLKSLLSDGAIIDFVGGNEFVCSNVFLDTDSLNQLLYDNLLLIT